MTAWELTSGLQAARPTKAEITKAFILCSDHPQLLVYLVVPFVSVLGFLYCPLQFLLHDPEPSSDLVVLLVRVLPHTLRLLLLLHQFLNLDLVVHGLGVEGVDCLEHLVRALTLQT